MTAHNEAGSLQWCVTAPARRGEPPQEQRRVKVAAERKAKALLLGPDYADPSLEVDAEGYIVVKEYTGKCLATNTAHMRSHIFVPCSMVPRGPAGPPSDASS